MAKTFERLVGPANIANGTSTVATVPALTKWILRGIRVVNNTAGSITFKLGIGGVTDPDLIVQEVTLLTKQAYQDNDLVVMEAGEDLEADASATGLTITVSGIEEA